VNLADLSLLPQQVKVPAYAGTFHFGRSLDPAKRHLRRSDRSFDRLSSEPIEIDEIFSDE